MWEKLLRKIYDPIRNNKEWRIKTNNEMRQLYESNNVNVIQMYERGG